MHIAIEGCAHGELDIIYNTIKRLEDMHKFKIDLLLCCGDFQSVRNEGDLRCMAVPPKYMQMQDFHRYYSGEMKAPILTIFIGGNHEASNYLQELPYGGWVAPNIYYLGYAGVVQVGDLRIGGLSGIYKGSDYMKGHFEKSPYNGSTMRSVYHIRNLEVFRLKQLSGKTNIFMSHDWPRGIYHHGNVEELLRYKEHFRKEISDNSLGSRPAEDLIKKMKPQYWFSGHLHVKFAALLDHKGSNGKNGYRVTKFLALDKCLPRREFLQVLELPSTTPKKIELKHDAEWLTILRLTNHLLNTTSKIMYMPGPGANERLTLVMEMNSSFVRRRKDESGDIIFEVPCITTSNAVGEKISDIDVSPIFTKSLRPKIFSSPISSSPRTSVDELPKLCSSLSTTTETDLDVSDLNRSPSLNVSFEPLNISSSQSEEESDSTERSQSLKRDSSSCDEIEGGSSSSESPIKKSKKLKRRNDSIYSNS
ncbi:Lariat debranching enzyme [Armadillidium vulgare]|nr:Lariat debranching enzyme [Armadillidium vulgare]